ncbi:glycosyltransferase family 4 protein [Candidatus Uhrbacteria bacterium]|nr:glycosyltransferase family 4 protein [Candidatus Uhrbacteria bacterium]
MKVLIISNLYEPYARGGAEAAVKTVAEGLAGRGHEVVVLTAGPPRYGLAPREEREGGVRVQRFFPLNIYFTRNDYRYPWPVRFVWRLIDTWNLHAAVVVSRVLAREKPDVVLTHNLVGIGLLTPCAIRRAGIRHIHTLHDVQLAHPSGLLMWGQEARAERSVLRRVYERVMRKLFDSPYAVISPSRWLLEFHTSRGFFPKSKTAILPNPVDTISVIPAKLVPDRDRGAGIQTLDPRVTPEDDHKLPTTNYQLPTTRLLYAGQLELHKGVRWLLRVAFSKQLSVFSIEIAGSGSLEAEIKKAAEEHPDRIVFHGKLTEEALQLKFREVDALVVPSLCYENAPRVIAGALSAGLPVIASRIGGIPEMIRDGENGFLFEPGNTEEFFDAIKKIKNIVRAQAEGRSRELLITVDQYLDALEGLCQPSTLVR